MIKLNINRTKISTSNLETLVVGNVNSIFVEFSFSHEWDALEKVVVFNNGTTRLSVSLSDNTCAVPWEVLSCTGDLLISLRGVGDGGNFVLCTENASLGRVEKSLADDDAGVPENATPDVIDTLIADVAGIKGIFTSGISETYFADDVQTSLGKADTALQSVPDTYRTSAAQDIIDNGLQMQIDALVSKSDVVDVVGTYAELQAYVTSTLLNNDVVKVLDDSTHSNQRSYYRWIITDGAGAWNYIGSEAVGYTKSEADALLSEKVDKVTGKGLSTNDYTDEDKAKVASALTETEIFFAEYGVTSFDSIAQAVAEGKKVQVKRITASSTYIYDLTLVSSTAIRFGQLSLLYLYTCNINTQNSWSREEIALSDLARANKTIALEQGIAHAGEILVVGSDGNVTTTTLSALQGDSH